MPLTVKALRTLHLIIGTSLTLIGTVPLLVHAWIFAAVLTGCGVTQALMAWLAKPDAFMRFHQATADGGTWLELIAQLLSALSS